MYNRLRTCSIRERDNPIVSILQDTETLALLKTRSWKRRVAYQQYQIRIHQYYDTVHNDIRHTRIYGDSNSIDSRFLREVAVAY